MSRFAPLCLTAALLLPAWVQAQTPQQTYRRDVAECAAGRPGQSKADCLYEARSVLRDALARKPQPDSSPQALAANAVQRCQRQLSADRADCERLARGEGTQQGSVDDGAVVKQIVTRTVGPVPPLPASSPASAP